MPKFLIERKIPAAGKLSPAELHDIAARSNQILKSMHRDGTSVHWLQSYISDDAIHCVYIAPSADVVREHARCGGFPADQVIEVRAVIDPTTGE